MVTYRDLAKLLGVTETTIKSYRKKFPPFLKPENRGKPLRFPGICASVCTRIRDSFANGLSVEETRAVLASEFPHLLPQSGPDGGDGHGFAQPAQGDRNAGSPRHGAPGAEGSAPGRSAGDAAFPSTSDSSYVPGPDMAAALNRLAQGLEHMAQAQERLADRFIERLDEQFTLLRSDLHTRLGDGLAHLLVGALAESLSPLHDAVWAGAQRDEQLFGVLDGLRQSFAQSPSVAPAGTDGTGQPETTTAQEPEPAKISRREGPVRKRVNVTNDQGRVSSYVLETRDSDDAAPEAPSPGGHVAETLRGLPLVIRSGRGEYLGVGGRSLGTVSLDDLAAKTAEAYLGQDAYAAQWRGTEDEVRLSLERGDGGYLFTVHRTTTPRGNEVAEITDMEVDGKSVPTGYAVTFMRQLGERIEAGAGGDAPTAR